jgi:DNA-binding GntR family transcriptional regulator
MRFHETLTGACGHRLLIEHLSSLQAQSRRLLVHVKQYGADLEHLVASHLPIVRALEDGDPTAVEQTVHDHITSAGERLLAKMSNLPPAPHAAESNSGAAGDDPAR